MNRLRRLQALLCGATVLFLSGCWPGIPIAIIAGVAGGGGGSSGGGGLNISGSIIVQATNLGPTPGLSTEHEPNDSIGFANDLGVLHAGEQRLVTGASSTSLVLQSLVSTDADAQYTYEYDLLGDTQRRFAALPLQVGTRWHPRFLTRRGVDVLVLDQAGPEYRLRTMAFTGGPARRVIPLRSFGRVLGMTLVADALLLLTNGEDVGRRHLLILNPRDGQLLSHIDLGAQSFAGLAGGEDLPTGRPRLFTVNTSNGTLLELPIEIHPDRLQVGSEGRSVPTAERKFQPKVAFDGILLHALESSGRSLITLAPDSGSLLAQRQAPPEHVEDLAAHFHLGVDGYRIAVPAAQDPRAVNLALWTPAANQGPQHWFFAAIDRSAALNQQPESVLFCDRDISSPHSVHRRVAADRHQTRHVDLLVGCLLAAGQYQILLNTGLGSPALRSDWGEFSPRSRGIFDHLQQKLVPALSAERLTELYTRFRLPDHVAGQVVLSHRPDRWEWTQSEPELNFSLREERLVSGGACVARYSMEPRTDTASRALRPSTWPMDQAEEDCRQLLCVLDALARDPTVSWCEPHYKLHTLTTTPNDTLFTAQAWHYDLMNLQEGWDNGQGSTGVRIAVVDSGVRFEADDLANRLSGGIDFVSDVNNSGDGNGLDFDPTDASDFLSHGTHVAGTCGAEGNNTFGVTGVMWDSTILPLRAIGNDGTGNTADITEAILHAAGFANASGAGANPHADVINLSLGSAAPSNLMQNAIQQAQGRDIVVVAATGNDGVQGVLFPAAFPETLAVGAADIFSLKADYSNFGPEVDVVAPGGSSDIMQDANMDGNPDMILSTVGDPAAMQPGLFSFFAGTSMACAHVSGLAGLIRSLNSTLSESEVRNLICSTAIDLDNPQDPNDDQFFGNGLVNAEAATDSAPAILDVSATAVDFGSNGTRLLVQTDNLGGGTLQVSDPTLSAVLGGITSWLTVSSLSDSSSFSLQADRTGLAPGIYQVQLDFNSNGGLQSVTAAMTVSSAALPDVGEVLIQVQNAQGGVLQSATTSLNSTYEYSVSGLSIGSFNIVCGVDLDDDGRLCEGPEQCGQYPSVAEATLLDLNGNIELDLLLE